MNCAGSEWSGVERRGSQFGVDSEACGIQWICASSGNSSCGLTRSGLGEGFNGERLAWPSGRGVLTLLLLLFFQRLI